MLMLLMLIPGLAQLVQVTGTPRDGQGDHTARIGSRGVR